MSLGPMNAARSRWLNYVPDGYPDSLLLRSRGKYAGGDELPEQEGSEAAKAQKEIL